MELRPNKSHSKLHLAMGCHPHTLVQAYQQSPALVASTQHLYLKSFPSVTESSFKSFVLTLQEGSNDGASTSPLPVCLSTSPTFSQTIFSGPWSHQDLSHTQRFGSGAPSSWINLLPFLHWVLVECHFLQETSDNVPQEHTREPSQVLLEHHVPPFTKN